MDEKITKEEFGARIRWKYPQYASFSNKEIADRVIQKYPQYVTKISDIETPEPKSFWRKAGDLFTSGTQAFGETLGQIKASKDVTATLAEAEKTSAGTEMNLEKMVGEYRQKGRDTTKLEQLLSKTKGRQGLEEQIKETIPSVYKTGRQVVGEAIQTGAEALSGGVISGISKVAPTATAQALSKSQFIAQPLKTRLKQIGVKTLKDTASLVPFGYAFDVATKLQEDKSGASVFMPGMSTAVSALIPLSIGGIQATRQIAATGLSKAILPNVSGVPSGAYERVATGEAKKYLGKVTPDKVLDEARASASAFKSAMQREFGEGKEKIIAEFTGKRIGIQDKEASSLIKIAQRFGFDDRLPQNMGNMSAKETMDLLAEINNISPITQFDDPLVKSLKLNLSSIKDDLVSRARNSFGGEGGAFQKIYQDYTKKASALKDIQSVIGKIGIKPGSIKLTPVQNQTATRRLQKVFNDDAEGYLKAIQVLEEETGTKILDKIAASQLSNFTPKSFRVNVSSVPGIGVARSGVMGLLDDIYSLVTFPLSSPRMSQWILRKVGGYDPSLVSRLLNATPSVRNAIYNAVNKENMAFSDAVELYAKEYLQNPKVGLSVENVAKNIHKEDKQIMEKFIDSVRIKSPLTDAEYFRVEKLAERFGISMDKGLSGVANLFDQVLSGTKKVKGTVQTGRPFNVESKIQSAYKETGNLTTKLLKDLEGKTTVSKQYILDATNRGELKQVERDLIRDVLERETGGNIPASQIKKEMGEYLGYKNSDTFIEKEVPLSKIKNKDTLESFGGRETQDGSEIVELMQSIRKNGFKGRIVIDESGKVLDGNHRIVALRELGIKNVPAYVKSGSDTINVSDFAKKVKAELLPLKVKGSDLVNPKFDQYSSRYMQNEGSFSTKYDNIALPDELRGKVANYRENIYESPIATSAGDVHFGYQTKNYFGHTRIEDMADNQTRRVIEVQSDLYQKGNLEREIKGDGGLNGKMATEWNKLSKKYDNATGAERDEINRKMDEIVKNYGDYRAKEIAPLQQYNDPTAHFRMIREEIKKASLDGKTKLQFPTGETALKIEGLGVNADNWLTESGRRIKPEDLRKGMSIGRAGDEYWIVTDVLGDGKFQAVPLQTFKKFKDGKIPESLYQTGQETFDISGKVDTNNPIYKFYEKDVQKYLTKFGGKRIVDDKGVSWIEVPIKKEWAKMPVEAFALLFSLTAGSQLKTETK